MGLYLISEKQRLNCVSHVTSPMTEDVYIAGPDLGWSSSPLENPLHSRTVKYSDEWQFNIPWTQAHTWLFHQSLLCGWEVERTASDNPGEVGHLLHQPHPPADFALFYPGQLFPHTSLGTHFYTSAGGEPRTHPLPSGSHYTHSFH